MPEASRPDDRPPETPADLETPGAAAAGRLWPRPGRLRAWLRYRLRWIRQAAAQAIGSRRR